MSALAFLATLAIVGYNYLVNGYVMSKLWTWFIVPLGVPSISISWAIGIAVIVSLVFPHESAKRKSEIDSVATMLAFLRPLVALLVGWVAHQSMSMN